MTLGGEVTAKMVNIPDSTDAVELLILDCSGRQVMTRYFQHLGISVGMAWLYCLGPGLLNLQYFLWKNSPPVDCIRNMFT